MKATSLRSKPDFCTVTSFRLSKTERVIEIAIAVVISATALLCACSWLKMLWPG